MWTLWVLPLVGLVGVLAQEDNLERLVERVPGIPGEDYPIYFEQPETSFICELMPVEGYYADQEADCQMYHVCSDVGNGAYIKFDFLCPNGTVFNQQEFVCDWWFNVDCSTADSYYDLNIEVAEKNAERQRLRELERELGEEEKSGRAELSAEQISQLFAGGDKPALQPPVSSEGARGSEANQRQGSGTSGGSSRRPGTGKKSNRLQQTNTRKRTKAQSKNTRNQSQNTREQPSNSRNQAQNTRFKTKNTRTKSANKRPQSSSRKQKSQNSFTSFGSSSVLNQAPEETKNPFAGSRSPGQQKNPFLRGKNSSQQQPSSGRLRGRGTTRSGKQHFLRPSQTGDAREPVKKQDEENSRSKVKSFTAFGNGQSRTFRGRR